MTNEMKLKIDELRKDGLGYSKIAGILGITKATVSSYCRRNGASEVSNDKKLGRCLYCGKPIFEDSSSKHRKFYSDKCRSLYWKDHKDEINKKTFHEFVCLSYGKHMKIYGKPNQKYCSLE